MNFIEAVKEMKEGKKVRRKCWHKTNSNLILVDEFFIWDATIKGKADIFPSFVGATDWEIVEKKTLYDKRCNNYGNARNHHYHEDDVKQSLKEFIIKEEDHLPSPDIAKMIDNLKEIFGENLV